MKVVAIEQVFNGTVPKSDLDHAVQTAMQPDNGDIVAAFWFEREGEFVLTTVFAGPEMIKRAAELGKGPRDLLDEESLRESLESLGPAPSFGEIATREGRLGVLSERYESNGKPDAIGFDATGGYSYGLYQLASAKGQVAAFLDVLSRTRKSFADALNAAGGDAAARAGTDEFKAAWKRLASNEPDFAAAQHAYIKATHYEPFCQHCLSNCRLDITQRSFALKNVAWSTAVQHGPGCSIFRRAVGELADDMADREIIEKVYKERSDVDRHFRSSTLEVRRALLNRFEEERAAALAMLA